MPEIGVPVIDLEGKVTLVGERILRTYRSDFTKYGLNCAKFNCKISGLPEEVERD